MRSVEVTDSPSDTTKAHPHRGLSSYNMDTLDQMIDGFNPS